MDVSIEPRQLTGSIPAVASKSVAHRLILLASLADGTTQLSCPTSSADIEATIACVRTLGAIVSRDHDTLRIVGIPATERRGLVRRDGPLDCGESGSTLRFLLPVVAALGRGASFVGHGRLAERPLSPLYEQLCSHGVTLSPQGSFPLEVGGRLSGGSFALPGNVSSQYVSGLLMAAPLLEGGLRVQVTEPVESLPYITLTVRALEAFGVGVRQVRENVGGNSCLVFEVDGRPLAVPARTLGVEGDWSNAAFWLAAGALCQGGIEVCGLDPSSPQGDRAMLAALALMGARVSRSAWSAAVRHDGLHGVTLSVRDIPDLVPPLAAVAAVAPGETRLTGAGRLRLKESDRLESVSAAIRGLGGSALVEGDELVIDGGPLAGGTVDAANDHRIAMMAAVMACRCEGPVRVTGADCVAKSYPGFWEDYAALGGQVERL